MSVPTLFLTLINLLIALATLIDGAQTFHETEALTMS